MCCMIVMYTSQGGNGVDEYMRACPHVILPNWPHLASLVYLVNGVATDMMMITYREVLNK